MLLIEEKEIIRKKLYYQAERLVALGLLCEANLDIENDTMILGDGVYGCTEFGKTFLQLS